MEREEIIELFKFRRKLLNQLRKKTTGDIVSTIVFSTINTLEMATIAYLLDPKMAEKEILE